MSCHPPARQIGPYRPEDGPHDRRTGALASADLHVKPYAKRHVKVYADNTDWLHFQTGAARLLPRLIGARTRGPLFLADRRPVPARAPATIDRCPETGRGRLSYRRAEALFREASGGWTLHQLRHSALTHLAEQNVSLPLLMAKSRHASLRSLQRYARPGAEAVGAMTAATDPARRRNLTPLE